MNTNLRAGYLAIALLCATNWLFAQKVTLPTDKQEIKELLSRADRQYDLYSYNLAIQTYQQVLEAEPSNSKALARIGDCNYQLNRPEKAVEWYEKAQNTNNMEADVPLRLGKALLQTGAYSDAKDQFLLYVDTDEKVGRHYANVADFALKNAKKEAQWQVKNEAVNTTAADYGAAFYFTRVAFNSARTDIVPKGKPSTDIQGGNTNYLFVSQRNPESELLQKPSFLRSDLQNNRNEGPVSFSANGKKVAFSRNRFISGTRQIAETGMNMSIYLADVEDGTWKNVKAFIYNGSNYATGFPSLSPDGTQLIFASTQPGGFGGWDLYISEWNPITGWTEPRNLGTPLNTPGNEVTPFFDGEDLYFSSDWHNGFGGLDVFRTAFAQQEVSEIIHLGAGVNSSKDDYGFIYNSADNIGYITSTRNGGKGNEDIWMVSKTVKKDDLVARSGAKNLIARDASPKAVEYSTPGDSEPIKPAKEDRLHLLITDQRGYPLSKAEVDLSDCYGDKGFTESDGKFYFDELLRPIDCNVTIRKSGYRDASIALEDFGKKNVKISLSKENREEFSGYVYDSRTKTPIYGATVQLQMEDGELETKTDEAGYYALNVEPGLTYLITYNKYGYTDAVVRTNFPLNGSNRIPDVTLEKKYSEQAAVKRDDYVSYGNTTKSGVSTKDPISPITRVYPKETAKAPAQDKFNGYSIQLASMPEQPSDARLSLYEPLTKLANLYVKADGGMNKIRLGIFPTLAEANENLKVVLQEKVYKGAWVVEERGADETLVIGSENVAPVQHNAITQTEKGNNAGVRYGIQLGSFGTGKVIPINEYYKRLEGVGTLYSTSENGFTKVRLGIWKNHSEAEMAKKEAIRRGYPDATIITERADDPNIRDVLESVETEEAPSPKIDKLKEKGANGPAPVVYSEVSTPTPSYPYYVRIAALSKPDDFDASRVYELGTIEKRKSEYNPAMTIILVGSYPDLDTATKIAKRLADMGYEDAQVVKEEKGKLVRKE